MHRYFESVFRGNERNQPHVFIFETNCTFEVNVRKTKLKTMKTNSAIRQEARAAMANNWGAGVVVTIVYSLITSVVSALGYGILAIFVTFPLALGLVMTYLGLVRDGKALEVSSIFSGFKSPLYWKSVGVYLLSTIYTVLWTLLLIVPGIIKGLAYGLAPYIMLDDPELTAEQAICKSMKMMDGHKMQLFVMILGMIVLSMLSGILLFIPLLWLVPYYQTIFAKFYEEVKAEQIQE